MYDTQKLYALYFGYILDDLLVKLRKMPTKENKQIVHQELKDYLGVKSISGMNYGQLQLFINKVLMVCAREKGIFVRNRADQPELIEDLPLAECWDYL